MISSAFALDAHRCVAAPLYRQQLRFLRQFRHMYRCAFCGVRDLFRIPIAQHDVFQAKRVIAFRHIRGRGKLRREQAVQIHRQARFEIPRDVSKVYLQYIVMDAIGHVVLDRLVRRNLCAGHAFRICHDHLQACYRPFQRIQAADRALHFKLAARCNRLRCFQAKRDRLCRRLFAHGYRYGRSRHHKGIFSLCKLGKFYRLPVCILNGDRFHIRGNMQRNRLVFIVETEIRCRCRIGSFHNVNRVVNFQSFLIAIEEIGLQNQAHGVSDVALQGLSGEGTVSQRIAHFLHLQAARRALWVVGAAAGGHFQVVPRFDLFDQSGFAAPVPS